MPKRGGGRPSLYRPEYADQAERLALLGMSNEELAVFFEVDPNTVYEWLKRYPEFREKVAGAREAADGKVAAALYKRAIGYTGQKPMLKGLGYGKQELVYVDEAVGPDVSAAKFWLVNRKSSRDRWKSEKHIGSASAEMVNADGSRAQINLSLSVEPEPVAEADASVSEPGD